MLHILLSERPQRYQVLYVLGLDVARTIDTAYGLNVSRYILQLILPVAPSCVLGQVVVLHLTYAVSEFEILKFDVAASTAGNIATKNLLKPILPWYNH